MPPPSATMSAMPGHLEVCDPEGNVRPVPINSDHLLIGRSSVAGLRLDKPSVSRRHAELVRDPFGRWWLRDLGSRSGIRVNGVRVKEIVLQPGDECNVGGYVLRVPRPASAGRKRSRAAGHSSVAAVAVDDAHGTEVSSLQEAALPKIDTLHLTTLTEFGKRLTEIDDPEERLRLLCRTMVRKDFHAFAAMALRLNMSNPDEPVQVMCVQSVRGWSDQKNYVSRNLLRVIRHTLAPALASNVSPDPGAVEMTISPEQSTLLSAAACPLDNDDSTLDLLYVILPPEYGTAEWLALVALAVKQWEQAESLWVAREEAETHAAIEQDLASARKIQMALVPATPSIPGLEVTIDFQPCRWVGGDYVDVVPMKDGRTLLALADVSGKGLSAALISLCLHSIVHTCLRSGVGLSDMMAVLNEHLCQHLDEPSFVTMVCVVVDPQTGAVECVNAGHLPAMIISPDGQSRQLQMAANFPLGLSDDMQLQLQQEQLEPGQLLAMVSDGLTEIADESGRLLGIGGLNTRLARVFATSHQAATNEVANWFTELLDRFEGGQLRRDDRSLLFARRPMPSGGT